MLMDDFEKHQYYSSWIFPSKAIFKFTFVLHNYGLFSNGEMNHDDYSSVLKSLKNFFKQIKSNRDMKHE